MRKIGILSDNSLCIFAVLLTLNQSSFLTSRRSMSNKIGFFSDLDDVLMNTSGKGGFKERRILAAKDLGYSRQAYRRTYAKIKKMEGYYDVNKHIELLTGGNQHSARLLRSAWLGVLRGSRDLAFKDAVAFLQFLEEQQMPIDRFLISRGEKPLQSGKLAAIGMDTFFTVQMYVSRESKGPSIVNLIREFEYEVAIFVDDKLSELNDVQAVLRSAQGLRCKTYLILLNRSTKTKQVPSLIESGRVDPLDDLTDDIIPVLNFGTLQKMLPVILKGGEGK